MSIWGSTHMVIHSGCCSSLRSRLVTWRPLFETELLHAAAANNHHKDDHKSRSNIYKCGICFLSYYVHLHSQGQVALSVSEFQGPRVCAFHIDVYAIMHQPNPPWKIPCDQSVSLYPRLSFHFPLRCKSHSPLNIEHRILDGEPLFYPYFRASIVLCVRSRAEWMRTFNQIHTQRKVQCDPYMHSAGGLPLWSKLLLLLYLFF